MTVTSSLAGKVAVLTGVSKRGQVGEAVARSFAESRVAVALVYRSGVHAEERVREPRAGGFTAVAHKASLAVRDHLEAVARAVSSAYGGIDALVNIACGFAMSGKVADSDPSAWSRQL